METEMKTEDTMSENEMSQQEQQYAEWIARMGEHGMLALKAINDYLGEHDADLMLAVTTIIASNRMQRDVIKMQDEDIENQAAEIDRLRNANAALVAACDGVREILEEALKEFGDYYGYTDYPDDMQARLRSKAHAIRAALAATDAATARADESAADGDETGSVQP